MMKCVAGIGLEENSSHKGVVMLRFILRTYILNCKSKCGLLEARCYLSS